MGRSRQGAGREREQQDLGHMPLLGSEGGVLWSSWAKAGLANSKQKEQVFGELFRDFV